jgi:hypothetical protein
MGSMKTPTKSPVSSVDPAFVALSELFAGPLQTVSFPGVDATMLAELVARAQERARAVDDARVALAAAEAELTAAELAFTDARGLLARTSQLALAYARVFAKDDAALLGQLDQVVLPRAPALPTARPMEGAAPKRRGRPRKNPASSDAAPEREQVAAE